MTIAPAARSNDGPPSRHKPVEGGTPSTNAAEAPGRPAPQPASPEPDAQRAGGGPPSRVAASPRARPARVPPHDTDAEMALLGSMMMSRDAIAEVVPIVGREDSDWFYLPAHQRLFEVLLDLYDDPTKAIDLLVVSDELRRRELITHVGGQEYLIQLAESFADYTNAEFYARIVRDKGMLRDLIRCTHEISEQAYRSIDEASDILETAEQKIFNTTERRVGGKTVVMADVVDRLVEHLERHRDGGCSGLATGFTRLDENTDGLQPGDLIIVAARPSMGKTALGLTIAQYIAVTNHVPVAFFSMEMSADQIAQRLVCSYEGIDLHKMRRGTLSEEQKRRVLDACALYKEAPLFIDDTPGMSAMELRASARRLKHRHNIQAVFVDYLQLMHIPRAENRQVEIATISRNLKSLGRELGIPVVALAQLNRMPEGRQDRRPLMSDLRESGAIEQDADVVLLIHREEYYRPDDENVQGTAELIIAKQRNGPTGTVKLHFDRKLTRFADHFEGEVPYVPPASSSVPF